MFALEGVVPSAGDQPTGPLSHRGWSGQLIVPPVLEGASNEEFPIVSLGMEKKYVLGTIFFSRFIVQFVNKQRLKVAKTRP